MKGVSFNPKTMLKHQALMQDYQELQKETEAIKNRLENTKQHKSVLLAEVRFLRRRHKQLIVLRRMKRIPNERKKVVCDFEEIKKEQRYGLKPNILDLNQGEELGQKVSRAFPVFDLNQIAREDHDVDDFRPMMMNGLADEDQKLNAGKGKRKISWQDPVVALKVAMFDNKLINVR